MNPIKTFHDECWRVVHGVNAVFAKHNIRKPDFDHEQFNADLNVIISSVHMLNLRSAAIASTDDPDVRRRIEELFQAMTFFITYSHHGTIDDKIVFATRDALFGVHPFAGDIHQTKASVCAPKKPENLDALIRSTLAGLHKITGPAVDYIDEPFSVEEIGETAGIFQPDGEPQTWRNWMTEAFKKIFGGGHRVYSQCCRNRSRFIKAIDSDGVMFRNTASMKDGSLVEDDTDWRVT